MWVLLLALTFVTVIMFVTEVSIGLVSKVRLTPLTHLRHISGYTSCLLTHCWILLTDTQLVSLTQSVRCAWSICSLPVSGASASFELPATISRPPVVVLAAAASAAFFALLFWAWGRLLGTFEGWCGPLVARGAQQQRRLHQRPRRRPCKTESSVETGCTRALTWGSCVASASTCSSAFTRAFCVHGGSGTRSTCCLEVTWGRCSDLIAGVKLPVRPPPTAHGLCARAAEPADSELISVGWLSGGTEESDLLDVPSTCKSIGLLTACTMACVCWTSCDEPAVLVAALCGRRRFVHLRSELRVFFLSARPPHPPAAGAISLWGTLAGLCSFASSPMDGGPRESRTACIVPLCGSLNSRTACVLHNGFRAAALVPTSASSRSRWWRAVASCTRTFSSCSRTPAGGCASTIARHTRFASSTSNSSSCSDALRPHFRSAPSACLWFVRKLWNCDNSRSAVDKHSSASARENGTERSFRRGRRWSPGPCNVWRAKAVVGVDVEPLLDGPRAVQRFSTGEDVAHRDPFCAIDALSSCAKLAASASILLIKAELMSQESSNNAERS